MGGLTDSQLNVSPVFYYTLVDMWGPFKAYCPGYERTHRRDKAYEAYFLVFAFVATGAVNVQLLEGKKLSLFLRDALGSSVNALFQKSCTQIMMALC